MLLSEPGALHDCASSKRAVQTGTPKVIVLQQISTARYLERSQIVRSSENYRLDVTSNDWWGELLSSMLSRVLIEELGQRLRQSTVIGESGAVSASPDATIELNIPRLDEDGSGNLVLQAQASVSLKGRPASVLRSFRFVVTPPEAGTPGVRLMRSALRSVNSLTASHQCWWADEPILFAAETFDPRLMWDAAAPREPTTMSAHPRFAAQD